MASAKRQPRHKVTVTQKPSPRPSGTLARYGLNERGETPTGAVPMAIGEFLRRRNVDDSHALAQLALQNLQQAAACLAAVADDSNAHVHAVESVRGLLVHNHIPTIVSRAAAILRAEVTNAEMQRRRGRSASRSSGPHLSAKRQFITDVIASLCRDPLTASILGSQHHIPRADKEELAREATLYVSEVLVGRGIEKGFASVKKNVRTQVDDVMKKGDLPSQIFTWLHPKHPV